MGLGAALVTLVTISIKLGVMAFVAWLIVTLRGTVYPAPTRRARLLVSDEHLPLIRALWWSLVLFGFSEVSCGAEIWILARSSDVLGVIHSLSSAAAMGLFVYALFGYLDRKLFGFGGRGCIGNRVCRGCPIVDGGSCRFRALLQLVAAFFALAAIPPFFASTAAMMGDVRKYRLPFPSLNAWYDERFFPWLQRLYSGRAPSEAAYPLSREIQIVDFRVVPALSLGLSLAAIASLQRRRELLGLRVLAFGAGILAYSYCELVLYRATGDAILGSLAHEVAELWFLLATAEFLKRTFRSKPASPSSSSS